MQFLFLDLGGNALPLCLVPCLIKLFQLVALLLFQPSDLFRVTRSLCPLCGFVSGFLSCGAPCDLGKPLGQTVML
ncbi:hypothetical protein [Zoogloea sp. 1C4]|uniref:hypothetical protein n=1 Tax=Zoogloea sp. 1C4 TaxID=2570190 RepID=UPI00129294BA|nr:hypothetical protein [Zoogloea sp. 1C4]